ncbi:MAG: inosine/xanthosine triphosphatase [Thermoanaerobaculia bacterium]|nr:inosine/xanthosine triphosphatase [Thermoanaerobaculia bacterium]
MAFDHRDFWRRYQTGIDVSVASGPKLPDKLLGVRDGFLRYFHDGLSRPIPVSVSSKLEDDAAPLPLRDEETLELARRRVRALESEMEDNEGFLVGTESGLAIHLVAGRQCHFVRTWTVIRAHCRESWGSSGALQIPSELIEGLAQNDLRFAVPGTRRGGGMVASLTGGVETRRRATALATFHALSSLLYGILESSPGHKRR